jgi:DNA-binding transcriptional LysR family regulator
MRLRHIEVFNAVMLTGSVSGAARLLNVSQPAVSRTLQHAEIQLGFGLFQRVRGRLAPTAEAQTLYPHIERLFAQLDEVQRLAANLRSGGGEDGGELRVYTVLALSYEVFPRAMRLFRQRYPEVKVVHEALHSPQIVSSLVLQEADVGYVFSVVSHPSLAQEELGEGEVVCVVPRALLGAEAGRLSSMSVERLAGLPVIALDSRDPLGVTLGHVLRESEAGVRPVMTVQTYHVALALAHHGVGVAMVERCTAASADRSRVDVLPLEPRIPVPIKALRPTGRPHSLPTRAFTRCMSQALQEIG